MKTLHAIIIWMAILPIKIYKWFISPLLPMACRHVPTCSEYTIEALKVHGLIKGSYLAVHRILRCHPWGTHGFDPVPPRKIKVKKLDINNL